MEIILILIFVIFIASLFSNSEYIKNSSQIPTNEFFLFVEDKNGQQYNVNIAVKNFPKLTALNLKNKKHEWYVIGFAKNDRIELVYSHKGFDNSGVHAISPYLLDSIIKYKEPTSIFILHNHPNGNLTASKQDKISAKKMKIELEKRNIKLHEFICARGNFKKYF